jgi:hypothetical protein
MTEFRIMTTDDQQRLRLHPLAERLFRKLTTTPSRRRGAYLVCELTASEWIDFRVLDPVSFPDPIRKVT